MGSLTPAYDERTDPFSDRFAGRWGFGFTEVPFKTHSRYAGARFAPQYTTREWLDAVARSLMTARKANLLTDEQADRFLPVLLTEGGNPAFMTDAWWPGAKARNVLRTMGLQHYNETFAPDTATMRERLQRYAQGAVSNWVMFNQQYPDLDLATQRWNGAGIRTDASGQV